MSALVTPEAVLAQLPKAIVVLDFEQRVLFWSDGATRLYRLTAEQMVGRPLSEAYRYEFLGNETAEDAIEQVTKNGLWIGITRHLVHDGRVLMAESEVRPFCDPKGEPIGMIASIREITERRQHELDQIHQAERNRALLRAVVDGIPDVVFLKDREGDIFW